MAEQYRAVVIGGGVVGASVLYHLTKRGWSDVALLERDKLTCGSSWHAAGGFHTINGDPNVAKLQQYTVELYEEIEKKSGINIGLHITGGAAMACTPERMDSLHMTLARGRYLGMEGMRIITPEEAMEIYPMIDPSQFVGGLWDPIEGHLDPSGTTHAYARCARMDGATIKESCKVESIRQRQDKMWVLTTNHGEIICEHVVNAGGLWAREVGRMVGLELPVLAMEHHYILTEEVPEVVEYNAKHGKEVGHIVDADGEIYTRQERNGVLLGTYERAATPWQPTDTPWDFSAELLPNDLDRIWPSLEVAYRHYPALEEVGLREIINGPFTFAPDGNPMVGPVKGMQGYWCACGVMAGFSQGGGVGLALSNWMVDGDPGMDVFAMDVARFGNWATLSFTNEKVCENYSRRFRIRFPNEELPAARPFRTSPLYDRQIAMGAQMGAAFGLEAPLWYAPEGVKDEFAWRRSTDFDHVGAEARNVRENVGIMEISGFSKFTVEGPGAEAWLDRMLACKLPNKGRMTLAPMLKDDGKLIGDFSLANLGDGRWFLAGSGVAEDYYMRWFLDHLPADGSVRVEPLGLSWCGVSIAGPKARELLAKVTWRSVAHEDFKFMAIREMEVGHAPCLVGRVTFTGDLGYEIWMKTDYARYVFDLLLKEGEAFGVRPFGLRALNALRLEKNWSGWAREYRPIYGPVEAGLERFVAYDKAADFIGKAAAAEEKATGGERRLLTFRVEATNADAMGDEPIWRNGEVVGWITSGGFAHAQGVSMAQGYAPADIADEEDGWGTEILGERVAMSVQRQPIFDANASRMRS